RRCPTARPEKSPPRRRIPRMPPAARSPSMRIEPVRACGVAALLALAGCTVGPDYARPEVPVPEHYRFGDATDRAAADTLWWQGFGDPVLEGLVKEALANNRDIDAAAGRVEQFYGALRTSRSALFPQVGAEAGG